MISYEMIFAEIEKQIQFAKDGTSDQKSRESLAAIKALCDVALQSKESQVTSAAPTTYVAPPQTVVPPQQSVVTTSQVNKIHEEDANGDSLFDF